MRKDDGERFHLRVTLTNIRPEPSIIASGVDDDGYEVVFTMLASERREARERKWSEFAAYVLDVQGHAILAYSGELGPWARARVPQKEQA